MADGTSANEATMIGAALQSGRSSSDGFSSGDAFSDLPEAAFAAPLVAAPAAAADTPGEAADAVPAPPDGAPAEALLPAASPADEPPADEAAADGQPVTEQPAAEPVAALEPAVAAAPAPRRRFSLLNALFAVLSLAGAAVALTAPALRPQAFELARSWLGDDSAVLRYLASPASDMLPAVGTPLAMAPAGGAAVPGASLAAVRAELIATLRLELAAVRRAAAEQAERVKAVSTSVQTVQSEAVSARGDARAATGAAAAAAAAAARAQADAARAQEAAARALDGTRDRFDRLDAQVATFDARVRATGLVVTAGQLRRDIEAGAPLNDDLVAIGSSGPLPATVQGALDQLSQTERGVPTLRDLAIGFETLDPELASRREAPGSSWLSMGGLFGSSAPQRDLLDRARALAAEGRFSEVADLLERSDWAELSKRWIGQVRLHADSVIAGQLVMAHALAAYEASQTTPPSWPQPAAGTGRVPQ